MNGVSSGWGINSVGQDSVPGKISCCTKVIKWIVDLVKNIVSSFFQFYYCRSVKESKKAIIKEKVSELERPPRASSLSDAISMHVPPLAQKLSKDPIPEVVPEPRINSVPKPRVSLEEHSIPSRIKEPTAVKSSVVRNVVVTPVEEREVREEEEVAAYRRQREEDDRKMEGEAAEIAIWHFHMQCLEEEDLRAGHRW